MRVAGKVALISGGAGGIGAATAKLLASEGAAVVIGDLLEDEGRATEALIAESGGKALFVNLDVTSEESWQNAVQAAVSSFGKLDILVNNAGVSHRAGVEETTTEAWDKVMDVNLKGTYLVSWFAVPEMEKSGGGSIVNLASIMGVVGYPAEMGGGFNPYAPSKGGVLQFTKNLAIDSARKNIRVNCLCPGYVETNLIARLTDDPESKAALEARHPMGRLGRPEEIAKAALFLASDDASYITGAPLMVDGGYTAQ